LGLLTGVFDGDSLMGWLRKRVGAALTSGKSTLASVRPQRQTGRAYLEGYLRRRAASDDKSVVAATRHALALFRSAQQSNAETAAFSSARNLTKILVLIDDLEAKHAGAATELRKALASRLGLNGTYAKMKNDEPGARLAYLANSPFPTRNANCIHTMRMCSSLAGGGYNPILIASKSDELTKLPDDIFGFFGVNPFSIALVEDSGNFKMNGILQCKEGLQRGATHFFGRSLVGCYAAALAGMPSVLEHHTPVRAGLEPVASDLFRQRSFRGLIVITHALKDYYLDRFPQLAGRVHVVPDAADAPLQGEPNFALATIPGTHIKVGYAGHLYPGKGAEIMLQLAARLPQVSFHVLGGYEDDVSSWQSKAAGLPNIVFYGFRPPRDVSAFLSAIDIAIAPYLRRVHIPKGKQEVSAWMSPLKLFEYMAHGLPIVSSDLPVLREVLSNEGNALLCDPDDVDAWVAAIERLAGDAVFRTALGQRAKEDFTHNYTWETRVRNALGPLLAEGDKGAFPNHTSVKLPT
jgi:glycosyltransferase involved in cell wall biosynthesis